MSDFLTGVIAGGVLGAGLMGIHCTRQAGSAINAVLDRVTFWQGQQREACTRHHADVTELTRERDALQAENDQLHMMARTHWNERHSLGEQVA
jgi:hypothetical protein